MNDKRITMKSDWESYTYFQDGTKLDKPEETIKTISILWPDLTLKIYNAIWVKEQTSYSDMGHRSYVDRYVLYIDIGIHGMPIKFRVSDHINKLMVCDATGLGL